MNHNPNSNECILFVFSDEFGVVDANVDEGERNVDRHGPKRNRSKREMQLRHFIFPSEPIQPTFDIPSQCAAIFHAQCERSTASLCSLLY